MFSGSPLFILTLTCLTKDAENVSKMLKARLEKGACGTNNALNKILSCDWLNTDLTLDDVWLVAIGGMSGYENLMSG